MPSLSDRLSAGGKSPGAGAKPHFSGKEGPKWRNAGKEVPGHAALTNLDVHSRKEIQVLLAAVLRAPGAMPFGGRGLLAKWALSVLVFALMAGLGPCLLPDLYGGSFDSAAPVTRAHDVQACDASAVSFQDQSGSADLVLASPLDTDSNTFYEGVSLTPPFPPPR